MKKSKYYLFVSTLIYDGLSMSGVRGGGLLKEKEKEGTNKASS